MSRVAALLLVMMFLVAIPSSALAQTPTPTGSTNVEENVAPAEEPELEAQPTERFRYIAVGLMFLMLFVLGAAYMRSVMKGAENR